jgi:Major intrinsic protein
MRYEQKTTIQSLAREQQLKQQHAALSPTYVHASPPPKDDELSFMGDNPGTIATDISLTYQLLAEAVGTYILVLIGCGAACVQVYGNSSNNDDSSLSSSWMMWTIGAMLGIYSAAGISGGHLNPAITMAFCWVRPTAFYPSKVVPYILAQIVGTVFVRHSL